MRTIVSDFYRAILSKGFWTGIIGVVVAGFFGCFELLIAAFHGSIPEAAGAIPIQLAYTALSSDILLMAAPILCTFASTTAFVEEYQSKYVLFTLSRSGKKPYLLGKIFSSGLAGGLSLFIGILILCGILGILFVSYTLPDHGSYNIDPALVITFGRFIQKAILFLIFGCFWALVGAAIATAGMNRYLAFACPFIIYFVLRILKQRYFRDITLLDPQKWLTVEQGQGIYLMALFMGLITVCVGTIYWILMKRRLNNV